MKRIILVILSFFALSSVCYSATANYGDDVAGGTFQAYPADYIYFHQISVTTGGTVNKISFYNQDLERSGPAKGAIYTDSGGNPSAIITNGTTNEASNWGIDEWVDLTFSTPPTVSDSTTYWIAIWSDEAYRREKIAGGSNNWKWDSEAYGGSWPEPPTIGDTGSFNEFDAYIEVELSSGAAQIIVITGN